VLIADCLQGRSGQKQSGYESETPETGLGFATKSSRILAKMASSRAWLQSNVNGALPRLPRNGIGRSAGGQSGRNQRLPRIAEAGGRRQARIVVGTGLRQVLVDEVSRSHGSHPAQAGTRANGGSTNRAGIGDAPSRHAPCPKRKRRRRDRQAWSPKCLRNPAPLVGYQTHLKSRDADRPLCYGVLTLAGTIEPPALSRNRRSSPGRRGSVSFSRVREKVVPEGVERRPSLDGRWRHMRKSLSTPTK